MFLYCSYTKPSRVRIWIQRYSVVALQRLIFRLAVGFLARKMGITKGEILKSVFFVQHIGIYIYIYKCPDISYRYIVFFRNMMINFRVGFGGLQGGAPVMLTNFSSQTGAPPCNGCMKIGIS